MTRSERRNHGLGCLEDIIDHAVEPEYFYLPEIYRIADIINRTSPKGIAAQRPAENVLAELDQEVNELLRLVDGNYSL